MLVILEGRSEANCFPMVSAPVNHREMMPDCADRASGPVDPQHPQSPHHSDAGQRGMCHLGCPVMLTTTETGNGDSGLLSAAYILELEPVLVGLNDIPQTPPPRFG